MTADNLLRLRKGVEVLEAALAPVINRIDWADVADCADETKVDVTLSLEELRRLAVARKQIVELIRADREAVIEACAKVVAESAEMVDPGDDYAEYPIDAACANALYRQVAAIRALKDEP